MSNLRHRKYHPLKEQGILSRVEEWETINWLNTDHAIARFLGITHKAVHYQRKKRGIARYCGRGGNTIKQSVYRP